MPNRRQTWTRESIIAEIRRLHRLAHPLSWTGAPRLLVQSAGYHLGSWRAAIEAAGLDYDAICSKRAAYSDAELLDRLRGLARERPDLTLEELGRAIPKATLKAHFGTWQNAVARAGLRDWPAMQHQRWTQRTILARLRELYRSGRTANDDPKVYAAAKLHFGSLAAACAKIGVEIRARRTWSREEVVTLLRRLNREHGTVTAALVDEAHAMHGVVMHFGGLQAACGALDLDSEYTHRQRERVALDDRAEVVRRLRTFATQYGRPVTAVSLPAALRDALLRHFGTIEFARHAANLPDPVQPRKWDRALVIAELQREHARGTRMTLPGLAKARRRDLIHAITEHLGSMPDARRLAGVPEPEPLPRKHRPFEKLWDADRVLDDILDRGAAGKSLAPTRVPGPLYAAASRYLGSWREAIEAAGFEYSAVVLNRPFEDGEVLEILRKLAAERPEMTVTELQHEHIATSLHRLYGGYENAVQRAGIRDWPVRVNIPRMPRAELRAALQARLAAGLPIDRVRILEDAPRLAYAIKMIHPDWVEAITRIDPARQSRRNASSDNKSQRQAIRKSTK